MPLKQMSNHAVASIETLRVVSVELTHPHGEISIHTMLEC